MACSLHWLAACILSVPVTTAAGRYAPQDEGRRGARRADRAAAQGDATAYSCNPCGEFLLQL